MNLLRNVVISLGLTAACIGATQAAPIYNTASFSGSINTITSSNLAAATALGLQGSTSCSGCAAGQVFGNVLYDINAEQAGGTGFVNNIALGAVEGATNAMIFQIQLGSLPLVFHFGDANIPAGGGPLMQFTALGQFNGFAFAEAFSIGADAYQFRMQGNTFTIKNDTNTRTFVNGRINFGNENLTNSALFVPGDQTPVDQTPSDVPEPGSIALIGLGLLAIGGLRRSGARAKRQLAA